MDQLTVKNFKSKMVTEFNGVKTRQDNIQTGIVFALNHYKGDLEEGGKNEGGDTSYLSLILQLAISVKGLRAGTIKNYIKASANVNVEKVKGEETLQFVKDVKGTPPVITIQTTVGGEVITWYEFEDEKVTADLDVMQLAKSLIKRIQAGLADDADRKVKDKAEARKIEKALVAATA